jgi:hypothetical protein
VHHWIVTQSSKADDGPYELLSVRKLVLTLTSRCAEIGLSMAGAEQQWGHEVYPGSGRGPYFQQVCARGPILQGTVMLVEGATSKAGEEEMPPSPC